MVVTYLERKAIFFLKFPGLKEGTLHSHSLSQPESQNDFPLYMKLVAYSLLLQNGTDVPNLFYM